MPNDTVVIAQVKQEDWPAALACFFQRADGSPRQREIDELVAQAAADPLGRGGPLAGLLEARHAGRRLGLVWVREEAGGTANLMEPRGESLNDDLAVELVRAAVALCRERRLVLAQSLLDVNAEQEARWLATAGFRRLAEIEYLALSASESAADAALESTVDRLDFEPFRPEQAPRLIDVVDASYEDTLDCPELNGLRSTADVLAGYQAIGRHAPDRWLIARHNGQDVGCLLLAEHVRDDEATGGFVELVYMGLVPAARGRGLGGQLVQKALEETRRLGHKSLFLAVDARNAPAISAYRRRGALSLGLRAVFALPLGSVGEGQAR